MGNRFGGALAVLLTGMYRTLLVGEELTGGLDNFYILMVETKFHTHICLIKIHMCPDYNCKCLELVLKLFHCIYYKVRHCFRKTLNINPLETVFEMKGFR